MTSGQETSLNRLSIPSLSETLPVADILEFKKKKTKEERLAPFMAAIGDPHFLEQMLQLEVGSYHVQLRTSCGMLITIGAEVVQTEPETPEKA